ncbi:helix-turn-helix transcriptional regulator [Pseudomonas sp. R5(2019)]|nr:helix-turn-helix transcriptional regulator [Pseudomonas sp. R5(2019)]
MVRAIHEGGLENQALSVALEALRVQFDANYVTLILRIPGVEDIGLMMVVGNFEAHGQVTYLTYRHSITPFARQPVDTVFTEQDVMTDEQWVSCSYFLDCCRSYDVRHIMGVNVSTVDEGVLRLRITRSSEGASFDSADRALCALLIPHLRQSLHVHNLLGRSESLGELYAQAINRLSLASIVLDESGFVLQLNDVARSLLDQADGLKLVGGRLEATYPSDNRELHKLLHGAFDQAHQQGARDSREVLSISRPSGEVNLGVVVEAIPAQGWGEGKGQPRVVVYVRDAVGKSQANNGVAKQLFNFTPAETALALELANGLSLEEAAEELGIMRNTARAHLRAIFSKTGVRRQAELVRVMLNSVVSLGANGMTPLQRPAEAAPRPELKRVR